MPNYVLIEKLTVQNANAVAGFTWGFPAITHFLGFVHQLERKIKRNNEFESIQSLDGVGVVSHRQQVHLFGEYQDRFIQSKNPPYLPKHSKDSDAPIIEEGKMNMMVSLLIPYQGRISENKRDDFLNWMKKQCLLQRLAGGSILEIKDIQLYTFTDADKGQSELKKIKQALLPGFILRDRAEYLAEIYQQYSNQEGEADMLDAWLGFGALKYKARPQSHLIMQHLSKHEDNELLNLWQVHLQAPYTESLVPQVLMEYFSALPEKGHKDLKKQWQAYLNPTDKTNADWELISKQHKGWLVPIMNGYKAISPEYDNEDVENTRDDETPVCFVEASHSIAQWQGVNRIKNLEDLTESLWQYQYQRNWYLCKKMDPDQNQPTQQVTPEFNEQDNYL